TNLRPLDPRRRVDVRHRYLEVVDSAVDLAQPMRRAGEVDDDVPGADFARKTLFDAHFASNRGVRIRVRIRIAVDGRRYQRAAGDERRGAFDHDHVLEG